MLISITGVTPKDAKELWDTFRYIYSQYAGDSICHISINGVGFHSGDLWKTPDDRNHFLEGFELGMIMNGVNLSLGGDWV